MQTYTAVGAAPTKARGTYRHRVAIIGGGTAGITVAAQLVRRGIHDVAIIEPSSKHYYQPLWTLVGAGIAKAEQSVRDEARFIPKGVRWIQDYAVEIDPEQQLVCTRDGTRVQHDFLVVAPGVESDWDKIQGARETLGRNGVCTNYGYDLAPKTWEFIQQTREGVALFTMPNTAEPGYTIKCGGAPQKNRLHGGGLLPHDEPPREGDLRHCRQRAVRRARVLQGAGESVRAVRHRGALQARTDSG